MIIKYDILFEVRVKHNYYADGFSSDFIIEPTRDTLELMGRSGLVFRPADDGFKIFAQVEPGTNPAQLVNTLHNGSVKFSFLMVLRNTYFESFTAIANYNPHNRIFYFSNLNEDLEGDLRFLGDHTGGTRIGNPIRLIKTEVLNYKFLNPENNAAFILEDIFGNTYILEKSEFSFTNPLDTTNEFQHNLAAVPGMKSGRYFIADNKGGSEAFYYDPAIAGANVFGIIEIFSDTSNFTTPPNDLVPASYKFIQNNALTGQGLYFIGFEAAPRKWMYVCRKNPDNAGNGLSVGNLTIEGPVTFSKSGGDDILERRIFSQDPITASDQQIAVSLLHDGVKIRDLPNPQMGTTVKMENNELFYQMYIYV